MRCREARQKLIILAGDSVAGEWEEALREHLGLCPDCAALARAERLLTSDLRQIRHVRSPHAITIDQVREGIAIREDRHKSKSLGVRIMQRTSDAIYKRQRLSLATAAVFLLLLASVLVPVGTEHSTGYEVAFAAPAGDLALNQDNAVKMLAALDMDEARVIVVEADSGVEYKIAPLEDSVQVQRLIIALDSLGGARFWNVVAKNAADKRTIWQLLLDDSNLKTDTLSLSDLTPKRTRFTIEKPDNGLKDDCILWMPIGDQTGDSLHGLVMSMQGDETNIRVVGLPTGNASDGCGWNPMANGKMLLDMRTPDGVQASFDLTDIDDVRELEEAGYNFHLMEFDTPGQIPIPGMGPQLLKIDPNPFRDFATIKYMVPRAYEVQMQILDEHRGEVCTLLDCIALAGIYNVTWDGRDADGNRVKPGMYLCRLAAGDYVERQEIELER